MQTARIRTDNSPVRVLLVEDDEDDYVLTRDLLTDGFGSRLQLDWAPTCARGLQQLTEGEYDVALVDHNLGGETGIDLLRRVGDRGRRIPIIMLTGQNDRETDLLAMHAGADDYLVKGRVNGEMLERAIRYARERRRLLEQISSLSLIDELTGLSNRRGFFTLADERMQLLERRGVPCLLVFADLDGLKQANDTRGHEAGDQLIIDAARVLRATFRRTDLVARLGGDEFVVLADEAGESDIELVTTRLEEHVTERNRDRPTEYPLSLSTGAISFKPTPSTDLPQLIAEADALMLECKKQRKGSAELAGRSVSLPS